MRHAHTIQYNGHPNIFGQYRLRLHIQPMDKEHNKLFEMVYGNKRSDSSYTSGTVNEAVLMDNIQRMQ